jgi:hypothetical protein
MSRPRSPYYEARRQAIIENRTTYHGRPCPHHPGHTLRYVNGDICTECNRERCARNSALLKAAREAGVLGKLKKVRRAAKKEVR